MAPKDEEEDFAALLAEYEGPDDGRSKKRRKEPQPGDEVRGKIISIGRDSAFVEQALTELLAAGGSMT